MLEQKHTLRETLKWLRHVELTPESRFWFGSPCRGIRFLDVIVHIVIPELIEYHMPRLSRRLRQSSPRWGRSWRHW